MKIHCKQTKYFLDSDKVMKNMNWVWILRDLCNLKWIHQNVDPYDQRMFTGSIDIIRHMKYHNPDIDEPEEFRCGVVYSDTEFGMVFGFKI